MAPKGKPWTHEETLIVLNLYFRIPFGRQHSRSKEIIELAEKLGRTPGSVAMKLNNFTSLDPNEIRRGISGLKGTSILDREVWQYLQTDWNSFALESERLSERIYCNKALDQDQENINLELLDIKEENTGIVSEYSGITEVERTVKSRYAQSFFRRVVLGAYDIKCCITGNPVPEMLIASHILPWATHPDQRTNPRNGLCLSRLHDAAFDQGLITFDNKYRIVLSKYLKDYFPNDTLRNNFEEFDGKQIELPKRFSPDPSFIEIHRTSIFRG